MTLGLSAGRGLAGSQVRICGRELARCEGGIVGGWATGCCTQCDAATRDAKAFIPSSPGRLDMACAKQMPTLPIQGPQEEGLGQRGKNLRATKTWGPRSPHGSPTGALVHTGAPPPGQAAPHVDPLRT